MKPSLVVLASAVALGFCRFAVAAPAAVPAAAESSDSCMDQAQSQTAMNGCALASEKAADAELNRVYRQVLHKHAADQAFLARIKSAQKAWLTFRDAELAARFPAKDKQSQYGSVYPMCASNEIETLTRQRTEALKRWLEDTPEGEVCAGSYPVAH